MRLEARGRVRDQTTSLERARDLSELYCESATNQRCAACYQMMASRAGALEL